MAELYSQTLKYFHLAIIEFLPALRELYVTAQDKNTKEELENIIEAYEDIDSKITRHNLNYDDPNKSHRGEPDEIEIDIPSLMIENLSRLSIRLLKIWKEKLEKLNKKPYLTEKNKEEFYKLENLIWPLEALSKADSYVLGKYAKFGPLVFPGESAKTDDNVASRLLFLLKEIQECYSLGDSDLLESQKLTNVENRIVAELAEIAMGPTDDLVKLKYKKLNSLQRLPLRSGFHNRKTAESKLENWRNFIIEIQNPPRTKDDFSDPVKTIKNRFKAEEIFVESRSQGDDQDLHLLIGKRNGTAEKAHAVIDRQTGEIRIEDNQQEPLELVRKIEAILTLPDGKKIRITREAIDGLLEN